MSKKKLLDIDGPQAQTGGQFHDVGAFKMLANPDVLPTGNGFGVEFYPMAFEGVPL